MKVSDSPNIVVVGLGAIGLEHAAVHAASAGVELVGFCDLDGARAEAAAQQFGGRTYESVAEIASDSTVDAVSLCTPDHLHVADATTLIRAGKHVLVEKPVALTGSEVLRLADEATRSEVVVMPGHTLRFEPRYHHLAQQVRDGALGEVIHGYLRRDNLHDVAERAGGRVSVAWFLGIHDVDALLWITGLDVVEVQAMASRALEPSGKQALTVLSTLRLNNGAVVQMESSWGLPTSFPTPLDAAFRLIGSNGEASLLNFDSGIRLIGQDGVQLPMPAGDMMYGRSQGALHEELGHFIDCVRTGSQPSVTMAQAARAVDVIAAVERAVETGKTVRMSPTGE